MAPKALARIEKVSFPVQHHVISGEAMPMENGSFDLVVSTFTLCSIAKVEQANGEIWRVMRPGGGFCFLEHGLSSDPSVASWQKRLNPIQQVLGDGCHLNRPMEQIDRSQPFEVRPIQTFYLEGVPRVIGFLYQEQAFQSFKKLSSRLAIGLQIQSQSISARSVTNPFRKALFFQIGQQIIPLGVIPGVISSKPVIQFLLGKSFLWFKIHFSLLRRFKKLIESRD